MATSARTGMPVRALQMVWHVIRPKVRLWVWRPRGCASARPYCGRNRAEGRVTARANGCTHGRLRRLLHHLAQLAGDGELALALHQAAFRSQDLPAHFGPRQTYRSAHFIVLLHLEIAEPPGAQQIGKFLSVHHHLGSDFLFFRALAALGCLRPTRLRLLSRTLQAFGGGLVVHTWRATLRQTLPTSRSRFSNPGFAGIV